MIIPGLGKEKERPSASDAVVFRDKKVPSASDAVVRESVKRKPLQELDPESVSKRVINLPSRYRE